MKKELKFYTANNILVTQWYDKRKLFFMSTVSRHLVHLTDGIDWEDKNGRRKRKLKPVPPYNFNMRQVDQNDIMISSIKCQKIDEMV